MMALPRRLRPKRLDVTTASLALGLFVLPPLAYQLVPFSPAIASLVTALVLVLVVFLVQPVRGLLVFALFMLFIDTLQLSAGPRIKQVDEIAVPLMATITFIRQRHRLLLVFKPTREAAVGLLLITAVLSSALNGVPVEIWVPGVVLLGKGLAIFYIALLLDVTATDVAWITRVVLTVGIVVLALGFVELFAPTILSPLGLVPAESRAGLPAIKSLFYHPQLFAWFCALLALYLFAYHAVLRRPWALALALVLSVGTILAARRRAIAAVFAGVVAGIVWEASRGRGGMWRRLGRWVPAAAGTLILFFAFLPAFAGLYQLTLDRYSPGQGGGGGTIPGSVLGSTEPAATPARLALYIGSIEIAQDHLPLGVGLGRYGSWLSREHYSPVYAQYGLDRVYGLSPTNPRFITDTFWPQILGELGILGLLAYTGFLAALGLDIWSVSRLPNLPAEMQAVILGTGLVFVQTLVESLASPVFNSPPQIYLIMFAVGGLLSWSKPANTVALKSVGHGQ